MSLKWHFFESSKVTTCDIFRESVVFSFWRMLTCFCFLSHSVIHLVKILIVQQQFNLFPLCYQFVNPSSFKVLTVILVRLANST